MPSSSPLSQTDRGWGMFAIALMRIAIGWHFAYEGLTKLLDPNWSAAGYLSTADWLCADLFHTMASDPTILNIVNQLNAVGLLLIGVALMFGVMIRLSAFFGVVMLAMYYMAHPSLFVEPPVPLEGSYLLVNKTVVELFAMLALVLVPAGHYGLDGLFFGRGGLTKRKKDYSKALAANRPATPTGDPTGEDGTNVNGRRSVLAALTGFPFVGGLVLAVLKKHIWESHEEQALVEAGDQSATKVDAMSGASIRQFEFQTVDDLKGELPKTTISTASGTSVQLSRMIMGGNLMNGFAHARDLIYVSKLIKAYHTQEKIFKTFRLGEDCGVDTIMTNPVLSPLIQEYRKQGIGEINFLAQCAGQDEAELMERINLSIDNGACAAYVQGTASDQFVRDNTPEFIIHGVEAIRKAGIPAGIGAHSIDTIKKCIELGYEPDFWVKTIHHHNYWSAHPDPAIAEQYKRNPDNMYCFDPDETIRVMESLSQPWIGFKVLAAGALHPRDGFRYAFEQGADMICIGMYDFQVVEDVNICCDVLQAVEKKGRVRAWC